jgi:hypothetical protein
LIRGMRFLRMDTEESSPLRPLGAIPLPPLA